MTYVVKIDGAPGAGKTHTLKRKLREEKRDGTDVHDFYWLTFTNAGRRDVEPELKAVYPEEEEDAADRARTFHSLANRMVRHEGLIPDTDGMDPIITPTDPESQQYYEDFCTRHGLNFDPTVANPLKQPSGRQARTEHTGNLLFAINDYLTQTCKKPKQHPSARVDIPIPNDRVITLLEAWDDYKHTAAEKRLFEHADYVAEAYEHRCVPSVEVLLIDEFQDLVPLEYQLYKLWRDSGQIERVYIAGDPNQSIYSFRGGTPRYFEETEIDDQIDLKTTYRCPEAVASVGNAILTVHDETDPRGFRGDEAGGIAKWTGLIDKHALHDAVIGATERHPTADPSVFLLTRTRRQRNRLINDLRQVGIPFELLGSTASVWEGDFQQLLAFLTNLKHSGPAFALANVRATLGHLPDGSKRREKLGRGFGGVGDMDAIRPALDGFADAQEILSALDVSSWERAVLKNALDAPAAITPAEIQVGTIHAAKGLEAPCVYLFAETTQNTVKRYHRNTKFATEEHRVYYVGASRASEELHIIDRYFDAPIAPPLETIKRQGKVPA